jgi:hypothetical protein
MVADLTAKARLTPWARISLAVGFAALLLVPARGQDKSAAVDSRDSIRPPAAAETPAAQPPAAAQAVQSKPMSKADAAEMDSLRSGLRFMPHIFVDEPLSLIGGLASHPHWTGALHLGKAQASALTTLDDVVRKARRLTWHADAEYPTQDVAFYHQYLDRSNRRLSGTIAHAERMVTLGLLTEPQAAFVTQRYLSESGPAYVLTDPSVQELLGMTGEQHQEMDRLHIEESLRANARLGGLDDNDKRRNQMVANHQAFDDAAMRILTESQLAKWALLTYKRELPTDPDLRASADGEFPSQHFKLSVVSPVFRTLSEKPDAYELSDDQKKLLSDLDDVTREGLFWICTVRTDPIATARNEFVKHAEQVALLGILTQRQAEQVEGAIKKE